MGKHEGKYTDDFEMELTKIRDRKKEIEREEKKAMVKCPHQSRKGKIKIEPVNDKGDYKCKKCGATFSMNEVSEQEICSAADTLHNAIQQIRCFADIERDHKLIKFLGELDFNLREINTLYTKIVDIFGDNKRKNKDKYKDKEEFGSYGIGSVTSFIGNRRK
jgi:transposase-like protein